MKAIYVIAITLLSLTTSAEDYLYNNAGADVTIYKSTNLISVDSRPQNDNEQIRINTTFEKYLITGLILKVTSETGKIDPEKYNKMLIDLNSKSFPDTKIIETTKISVKFKNAEKTGSLIKTNYHEKSTLMCDINTAFSINEESYVLLLNVTTVNTLCEENIDKITSDIRELLKSVKISY